MYEAINASLFAIMFYSLQEMAVRVSMMLNFNLQQLCGPKCSGLKVY